MKIVNLKVSVWKDTAGNVHNESKRFNAYNSEQLQAIIDNTDPKEDLDIHVINEIQDCAPMEIKLLNESIKYIILDLLNSESSLRRYLKDFLGITEIAAAFNFLMEKVIVEGYVHPVFARGLTSWDAFYGNKGLHFRVYLESKGPWQICLGEVYQARDFMPDEFVVGVILQYYNEITAWDRERLRNDEEEMKYLQENWIESLRISIA